MKEQTLMVDGVKWYVTGRVQSAFEPLCPKHHLRLHISMNNGDSCFMKCEECDSSYRFPRSYHDEVQYILDKIDSKIFKKMKFINLDDEAIPLAETKISSKDQKFFVTGLLTESKVGQRLIIYAGEKGKKEKTQIFVEPDIRRLAFDQNNIYPSEVFVKLEATFNDDTKASIERSKS